MLFELPPHAGMLEVARLCLFLDATLPTLPGVIGAIVQQASIRRQYCEIFKHSQTMSEWIQL